MSVITLPYAEDLPLHPDWPMDWLKERWEASRTLPEIDLDLPKTSPRIDLMGGSVRPVALDDGRIDRSKTLFLTGLDLADRGASLEEIVATLREADENSGFRKYSRRRDGGRRAYTAIAQAAMASLERRDCTHPEANVPFTVEGISIYIKKDSKRKGDNTRPSALWDFACRTFPDPPGVNPRVKSHILYPDKEKRALVCDLRSNTWQNPANAAYRKRKTYYHLTRKLSMFEGLWHTSVAADDWNENSHDALTKRIERAGGMYLAFNNMESHGTWEYLSTVPLAGFDPVKDLSTLLIRMLKGIRAPDDMPKGNRFRPIRGTQELTKGTDAPVDDDRGKYQIVAESDQPTDWAAVEADLRERGIPYEEIAPVYRAQHGGGIAFAARNLQEVRDFAVGFGQLYKLRKLPSEPRPWGAT